jgi:hypothetical protein
MRRIIQPFSIVERVLRDRTAFFAEIARGEALPRKIAELLAIMVFGLAIFGFVAGLSGHNIIQALVSTIKLPFLFLACGIICLPTLYYFSILFGSRLRFLQIVTLILTAQTVAAVLALGAAPISLLFFLSGSELLFLVALNTAVLALAAGLGLIFLVQGALYIQEIQPPDKLNFIAWTWLLVNGTFRSLVLMAWILVYALVGTRLSYALRPFFGVPLNGNDFWSNMGYMITGLLSAGR